MLLGVALLALALLAVSVAPAADAGTGAGQPAADARDEVRLLVRWVDGVPDGRRAAVLDAVAAGPGARREAIGGRIDAVTVAGPTVARALASLAADPDVEVVEADRVLVAQRAGATPASVPTDPLLAGQWGLRNDGRPVGPPEALVTGVAGIDANVVPAWSLTRGDPQVLVGVIDTALDATHPDLRGAVIAEIVTAAGSDGERAHGTGVASIIAARADDGVGMVGVAPQVSVLSLAAFGASSADGPIVGTLGSVVAAFDAAAAAGVDVINASWTTREESPLLRQVIADAGVPVVAASGNEGDVLGDGTRSFPASYDVPNIVTVTAIDPRGALPRFANVGRGVVDVGAPGTAVLSAVESGGHAWQQGTSAAAPFVSGGLALALSVAPYATTGDLIDAVSWTSTATASLVDATASGGRLDVAALVRGVQRPVCRPDLLPSAGFSDVGVGNVHRVGIDCLAATGVTRGRGDGTYDPTGTVTRGQMATFVVNLLERGGPLPEVPPAGFVDVGVDHPHGASIDALAGLGIVRGDALGRFRPDVSVTRGQVASLLVSAHEFRTGSSAPATRRWFDDTSTSTHVDAIDRARDLGLVRGVARVRFDPSTAVRRDQMGSVIAQVLDALARGEESAG